MRKAEGGLSIYCSRMRGVDFVFGHSGHHKGTARLGTYLVRRGRLTLAVAVQPRNGRIDRPCLEASAPNLMGNERAFTRIKGV